MKIILGVFLLISSLNLPQGGQVDPVHHRVLMLHVQSSSVREVCPGAWIDKDSEHLHFVRRGKKGTFNFLFRYVHGNIRDKGIKNFHLNIRSMKFKVLEIKNIIKEHSPHIIGLSECELRKVSTNASDLRIPGYDVLFPRSWDVHGYARVIVYVKKSFHYEQINELEDNLVQSIWLRGNFKNGKKIYFCHGYREHLSTQPIHNQLNYLVTFLSQWEVAAEFGFPTEPNEVHISLDMNLDAYMGRWLQSDYRLVSPARLVQDACNIGNFTQLVTEPTRSMFNSVASTT